MGQLELNWVGYENHPEEFPPGGLAWVHAGDVMLILGINLLVLFIFINVLIEGMCYALSNYDYVTRHVPIKSSKMRIGWFIVRSVVLFA